MKSGAETWMMLGAKARRSSRVGAGSPRASRYSPRPPGIPTDGTLTRSPVGGNAGSATVGE